MKNSCRPPFLLLFLAALGCAAAASTIGSGGKLALGECISSEAGDFHLCLRKAGLVIHAGPDSSKAADITWSSPKVKDAAAAELTGGALSIVNAKGTTVWSSGTSGADTLALLPGGRLVLFASGWVYNTPVWSSDGSVSNEVKEPATGIALPRRLAFNGNQLTLLGVGVRQKAIAVVSVNVYAVGLYLPQQSAAKALSRFSGAVPGALAGDASYYSALSALPQKYLHLIFARAVAAHKVVDALTAVVGVPPASLERFTSLLLTAVGAVGPRQGQSISLGADGGTMVVLSDGKFIGEVKDAALAAAVFDLYVGKEPVSPAAKEAFASGLGGFLAATPAAAAAS